MNKKIVFFLVWLIIISIGPVTVLRDTPIAVIRDTSNQAILLNFLQRIVGTAAFGLLVFQIMLGAYMKTWTQKLGAWVFKFHLFEGALIYSLVILHPLLFVLYNFKIKGVLDPFYVYTDLCVLCSNKLEFFYNFGRIAFWLITIAVTAAKFRTYPALRLHWRKFHILNYLAFFAVVYHSWNVGTDVRMTPFVWLFWTALALVTFTIAFRLKR